MNSTKYFKYKSVHRNLTRPFRRNECEFLVTGLIKSAIDHIQS